MNAIMSIPPSATDKSLVNQPHQKPWEHSASDIAVEAGIEDPRLLLTRDDGDLTIPLLRDRLQQVPPGQPLILCFQSKHRMDVSFADAAIVNLALEIVEGKFSECGLLLKNLSQDLIDNIEGAIKKRDLKLALLAVYDDGTWRCIGHLENNLRETLEQVAKHDGLGASELCEMFDLAINTASNRLKKLHDQHLVRREAQSTERGLQYVYYFWKWTVQ